MIVEPTIEALGDGVARVTWAGLQSGDSGAWMALPRYRDKTVTVEGTSVTTFALQGSNYPGGDAPRTLNDVDNTTAIDAAGMYVVKENPLLIRPLLTTGQDVTVIVVAK